MSRKKDCIVHHNPEESCMYKYLLLLTLTINASYASGVKLVEDIASTSGIMKVLTSNGISSKDATEVKVLLDSSLAALGVKSSGSKVTEADIKKAISGLSLKGEDANKRKALQLLLDKPSKDLKKADVVNAINNIAYLASRQKQGDSKSAIFLCSTGCSIDSLSKHGFTFSVQSINNSTVLKTFNEVANATPAALSGRMKKLGLGDYSKVTPELVGPGEEKSFALFVSIAEVGTAEQKALVNAIKKLSGARGETRVLDPKNPHRLWKVVTEENMTSEQAKWWTDTIEDAAVLSKDKNMNAKDAFFATLDKQAGNNKTLKELSAELKSKNCFFKPE